MVKVIMHGCNGKMGQVITGIIAEDKDAEIVAGVDTSNHIQNTYPVFGNKYCVEKQVPCVLCTTGLSEAQLAAVEEASKKVAILRSANMSLGVNMLLKILKEAAGILAPAGFDIEIVEKHHNLKVDAPSGTALALADSINEELGNQYEYVYDRSQVRQKRSEKEIGISSVRGGTIVGDHDVIFAGMDEVVTFSHRAYSKAVFGKGAVQAAKFLAGKPAGKYEMSDVIDAEMA